MILGPAKKLYLDKKGRYYKKRLATFLANGYKLGKEDNAPIQELILDKD